MADGPGLAIRMKHRKQFQYLNDQLVHEMHEWMSFRNMVEIYLPLATIIRQECSSDVLDALQSAGWIAEGNYGTLIRILDDACLIAMKVEVETRQAEIQELMRTTDLPIPVCRSDDIERKRLHRKLYEHLNQIFAPNTSDFRSFKAMTRTYLQSGELARNENEILDILRALETKAVIGVGNYAKLEKLLEGSELLALKSYVAQEGQRIANYIGRANTISSTQSGKAGHKRPKLQ